MRPTPEPGKLPGLPYARTLIERARNLPAAVVRLSKLRFLRDEKTKRWITEAATNGLMLRYVEMGGIAAYAAMVLLFFALPSLITGGPRVVRKFCRCLKHAWKEKELVPN